MRQLVRYLAWFDKPRHSSEKPLQASTLGSLQDRFNANLQVVADHHADRRAVDCMPSSPSTLLFSAAMAQINTPKTALATTSATEYPICSPAVAATPEIPIILMMYTKG